MIGQLIEELCIANIKLFNCCNMKVEITTRPENFTKKEMVENAQSDISLCKRRAQLKTAIDNALNSAILSGGMEVIDEIKQYG